MGRQTWMEPSAKKPGGPGGSNPPRDAKGHFLKRETAPERQLDPPALDAPEEAQEASVSRPEKRLEPPAVESRRDRPPLVAEVQAAAVGVQVSPGPAFHYETHFRQCGEPLAAFLQPHGLCGECLTAGPGPGMRMLRPGYGAGEP